MKKLIGHEFVTLIGKSRHGKTRCHQHGTRWRLTGDGMCRGQPAWLVMSLRPTDRGSHDQRWIFKTDDPDFIIKKSSI